MIGKAESRGTFMQTIRPQKMYEVLTEYLKEMILSGELKEGQKIPPTQELIQKFNIGKASIREAVTSLQAMGLVEIKLGGTFVRKVDPLSITISGHLNHDEIGELFDIRKILEIRSVSLAAQNWMEDDLHFVEKTIIEMKNYHSDETQRLNSDLEFHLSIARASHNKLLLNLIESILKSMAKQIEETHRILISKDNGLFKNTLDEHFDILDALYKRDVTKAGNLMNQHLFHVQQLLSQ